MFANIPVELQERKQWVCWRLEVRPPQAKPTKTPYNIGGYKASVTNPETWSTFAEVCGVPLGCQEAVEPIGRDGENFIYSPLAETGYSGIGYVFSAFDPYAGIDFDDAHGDAETIALHQQFYARLASYSELSPSGQGCHVIVKGQLPIGRRRMAMEIYSQDRFFTMTGNVINPAPIREAQDVLNDMFELMGGDVRNFNPAENKPQVEEDNAVYLKAKGAVNGEKFTDLFEGNWQKYYGSQSEADLALIDIVAFYTSNMEQVERIFMASTLGERDKARRPGYVRYMVEKSFDRKLPPVDTEGLRVKFEAMLAASGLGDNGAAGAQSATEPGRSSGLVAQSAAPATAHDGGAATLSDAQPGVNPFPPGLIGAVAQFIYDQAPRQVPIIALAGAIGYLAGITGRAYNIGGAGLNQYIMLLAETGVGKDAIADGIAKLQAAILPTVPSVIDFKGPGELVSGPALIKSLEKKPCFFSILGEFGKKLKEMTMPHANQHAQGLNRLVTQLYTKSGHAAVFDRMDYSDREKNVGSIKSPSLTLIAESVPSAFFEALDDTQIEDGLLSRLTVFEYKGKREYFNPNAKHALVPFGLAQELAGLAAHCLSTMHATKCIEIPMSREAEAKLTEYDRYSTDLMNTTSGIPNLLWNRVHLKALKLAALAAVSDNWHDPEVQLHHAMWGIDLIHNQTIKLIAKFETGLVGQSANSGEAKQLKEVIRIMYEHATDAAKYQKYGGTPEMAKRGVVTESSISKRVMGMSAFKNDRMGATHALKRTLKTLLEADDIREIPKAQMMLDYGCGPRAFSITNAALFMPTKE